VTAPQTAESGVPGGARRPLRIGIEAHVVGPRPSGNGRTIANLIGPMVLGSPHRFFCYFTNPVSAATFRARRLPRTEIKLLTARAPYLRIPFALPYHAARDRLDVLLAHDNRPPLAPCPVVTLIHDTAFARHPEFFSRFDRLWMNRTIPFSARHSAGVVTDSQFSKDELVELYGVAPDRIGVYQNAVDPIFLDPTPRPSREAPPYFLAVGNVQPRKNLSTLIRAYRTLLDREPDMRERLVLVGNKQYLADDLLGEGAGEAAAGRLVYTGYVSDEELAGLFQHATAFVYPSVYEGFGLPPLEAMAVGTPAIVSDIPVMREVVGDAAVRVPVRDASALADAMARARDDAALRARLIEAGRMRAASFTWQSGAASIMRALERAAG
jgi:glycosyltransferase involved in cell wall biosynthesis